MVNAKFAEKLELSNIKILDPKKEQLLKLIYYVPQDHAAHVREALWNVGCGEIGKYDHCSFNIAGTGTFRGNEGAEPL
ncbi:MAG: hypothetical protein R2809_11220 [Flavobacteriales bacterium]